MADGLTDEEWAVWDAFYSMRRRLDRALEVRLHRGSGVSAPEYEILAGLGRLSDRRLRVRDIAEQIGWEKSRVSHQVTRMEKRGLVRRSDCDADGRGTWVELTAGGRRAMLEASRGHNDAIRRYFVDTLEGDGAVVKEFSDRILQAIRTDSDAQPCGGSDPDAQPCGGAQPDGGAPGETAADRSAARP